jgi:hypothetical protein
MISLEKNKKQKQQGSGLHAKHIPFCLFLISVLVQCSFNLIHSYKPAYDFRIRPSTVDMKMPAKQSVYMPWKGKPRACRQSEP